MVTGFLQTNVKQGKLKKKVTKKQYAIRVCGKNVGVLLLVLFSLYSLK